MMKYAVPIGIVVIIVIAAIVLFTTQSSQETADTGTQNTAITQAPSENQTVTEAGYADGEYQAIGNYVSPGGPRQVNVTITLEDGVITDSVFVGGADDPTSQRFQGEFADNYKPMVVGKNIDEVALTKVSGSSLTPIGFTDALTQIKAQAKSS